LLSIFYFRIYKLFNLDAPLFVRQLPSKEQFFTAPQQPLDKRAGADIRYEETVPCSCQADVGKAIDLRLAPAFGLEIVQPQQKHTSNKIDGPAWPQPPEIGRSVFHPQW